jgi:hypothetical protein
MASPRNHALISAYTILFTLASGILCYDLCTHESRALPDVPVAAARLAPPVQPAPIASLEAIDPAAAPSTKPARIASEGVL